MSDRIKEQLSAFVDGQLPDAERELLERRLDSDDELRGTWQRYHLIRDAMREDLPEYISRPSDTDYLGHEKVHVSDHAPVDHGLLHRIAKPAAGFAIAASVAMLAVVGVLYNNDSLSPSATPTIAESQPAQLPDYPLQPCRRL